MAFDLAALIGDRITMARTLIRSGLLAPLRPDTYLRMAAAVQRSGMTATVGFAANAQRCPHGAALVDEIGTLSWRQLDERCNALAVGFQHLRTPESEESGKNSANPETIAIMCRNHRGFVEALVAADRIGASVLLLNTSFAGPALADVAAREGIDVIVYDNEFTGIVDQAVDAAPGTTKILAWTDDTATSTLTVDELITRHHGARPHRPAQRGTTILLTSGTTGAPKGARRAAKGGAGDLAGILAATPWRAEEVTVISAPMFHAWGYSQLLFSALMACTIVTHRRFDAEITLQLVDRHRASGLCVVPVMLDRIVDLPDDVRNRYSGRSLRFVAASGSRMRADVIIKFMDQFGDVIYNNYNATEAGMIALADPADLRAAPDTAGRAAPGTELAILDAQHSPVPTGEVGQIFVRSSTPFDGYTSGVNKVYHDGFMASGDLGYLDDGGRLFVVGRDDEMIVSGGENVYPIEVENCLLTHPAVADAAVFGIDDEGYGQRLAAWVVLGDGATASADQFKAFVHDRLANFKVPREVVLVDELPRGATGKVLRTELRGRLRADSD